MPETESKSSHLLHTPTCMAQLSHYCIKVLGLLMHVILLLQTVILQTLVKVDVHSWLLPRSESLRFSMVGLESLVIQLREKIMRFQLRVSSEQLPVNVDYVLASGNEALLGTMSWMQVTRMQQQDILSSTASALQVRMRHSVQCFCGLAGSGKSHSIAKALPAKALNL